MGKTGNDGTLGTDHERGRNVGGLAPILVSCLFVLGAMLLMLDGVVGLGAGDSAHAFTGTWTLVGTAHDDAGIDHRLDDAALELREDGTAVYAGRDATSLLTSHTTTVATWSANASGVGTLRMGGSTFLMTLDGSRLVLETDGGTLVFVREEP